MAVQVEYNLNISILQLFTSLRRKHYYTDCENYLRSAHEFRENKSLLVKEFGQFVEIKLASIN